MNSYFYCYDGQLMKKLQEKNIRYITRALTVEKHMKFWLYEITSDFQAALDEIKKGKLINKE